MYTLDIFTDIAPKQFLSQSAALCQLIGNILKSANGQDLVSPIVFHAFRTLTNMTIVCEQDQAVSFSYVTLFMFVYDDCYLTVFSAHQHVS